MITKETRKVIWRSLRSILNSAVVTAIIRVLAAVGVLEGTNIIK